MGRGLFRPGQFNFILYRLARTKEKLKFRRKIIDKDLLKNLIRVLLSHSAKIFPLLLKVMKRVIRFKVQKGSLKVFMEVFM